MFFLPPYDQARFHGSRLDVRDLDRLEPVKRLVRLAARCYFRAEISGWENVPPKGRLLVIGNHNGGFLSPDMAILITAWNDRYAETRPLYALAHDMVYDFPPLATFVSLAGGVRATRDMAHRVLAHDNASLLIYPGGGVDFYRPFRDRYRIELAGHTGFVRLALEAGVPIQPVVSCGAHESIYVITSNRWLMEALGLNKRHVPVWPLMVSFPLGLTLGPLPSLPLPTRVQIHFEEPFMLEGYGPQDARDDAVVARIYAQVQLRMQRRMDMLAARRRLPVFL